MKAPARADCPVHRAELIAGEVRPDIGEFHPGPMWREVRAKRFGNSVRGMGVVLGGAWGKTYTGDVDGRVPRQQATGRLHANPGAERIPAPPESGCGDFARCAVLPLLDLNLHG